MAKDKKRLIGIDSESGDDEVDSLDQAQSRGMMGLMNVKPEHIEKLTQIDDDLELKHVAVMKSIGREFNIPMLDDFITDYLELKISMQRKGRNEIVDVLSSSIRQKLQENMSGVLSRVKGMIG